MMQLFQACRAHAAQALLATPEVAHHWADPCGVTAFPYTEVMILPAVLEW
ncbi:hypothetical protein [Cupriavidus necator]